MRTHAVRSLLVAFSAVQMLSAAVNCRAPKTRQQEVVCSTPELLSLDQQLSVLFAKALAAPGANLNAVKMLQDRWENDSGGCPAQVACLKRLYDGRIHTMEAQIARSRSAEGVRGGVLHQKRQDYENGPVATKRRFDEAQAEQRAKEKAEVEAAQGRFERLNAEKTALVVGLGGFKDMGPLPSLESTVPRGSRRRGASVDSATLQEASDKIEQQLPLLRAEAAKRQQQALLYANEVLRRSTPTTAEALELDALIASSGRSLQAAVKAYQAAQKLDAAMKALVVAKQRSEKDIASARADLASAGKFSGDPEIVAAARITSQTMNELSAKAKSNSPSDESQISALASKLESDQARMTALMRQSVALSSNVGKRVQQGCLAWAKRSGLGVSSSVRVFKDEATNKAADLAANNGSHFCRCMAAEIGGDEEITDAAKLEIARQFETKDRIDNDQLRAIVAAAGMKCQYKYIDQLSGGQLTGRR